jgi:hypothetical protein
MDAGELNWAQLEPVLRAHVFWLRAHAGTVQIQPEGR